MHASAGTPARHRVIATRLLRVPTVVPARDHGWRAARCSRRCAHDSTRRDRGRGRRGARRSAGPPVARGRPPSPQRADASRHLTYRALSVAEPFGGDPAPALRVGATSQATAAIRWISGHGRGDPSRCARGADPGGAAVSLRRAAAGARRAAGAAMPGAMTFAGPRDVLAVRQAIEGSSAGRRHRIVFVATAPGSRGRSRCTSWRCRRPSTGAATASTSTWSSSRARLSRSASSAPTPARRSRSGSPSRACTSAPGRSPRSTTKGGCGWSSRARSRPTSSSRSRGSFGPGVAGLPTAHDGFVAVDASDACPASRRLGGRRHDDARASSRAGSPPSRLTSRRRISPRSCSAWISR